MFTCQFGKQDIQEVTLKPGNNGVLSQTIKYAHTPNDYGYQYDISWHKRGGIKMNKEAVVGDSEFIFADELPDGEE